MPIKWISDREYIVVGQGEESKNMSENTISGGWSPRYADLAELDQELGIYDMDATLEVAAMPIGDIQRLLGREVRVGGAVNVRARE